MGGPPPPTPPQWVLFDGQPAKVKGLEYRANERPTPTSPPGTQYCEFSLSIEFEAPPGWEETGVYQWVPTWQSQQAPLYGQLVVKEPSNQRTAVGAAYNPGVYSVTCYAQIREIAHPSNIQWVPLTGDCAVIGGPLVDMARRYLENTTLYQQSKVWELLVRWETWNALKGYYDTLRRLLRIPGRYESTQYHIQFSGLVRPGEGGFATDPELFEADTPDMLIESFLTATNVTLLRYWLTMRGGLAGYPVEQKLRYAKLLDHADPEVVYRAMVYLANVENDQQGVPRLDGGVDGQYVRFPDLNEKRAYWKEKLGIK